MGESSVGHIRDGSGGRGPMWLSCWSDNIHLCFAHKSSYQLFLEYFRNLQRYNLVLQNIILWTPQRQFRCHTFNGQKSWWARVKLSFMIYYGYYYCYHFHNSDSSGLQGCSTVEFKSFFVWPLTCILFAQQHYALRHLASCSCGAEPTGVKWFGCTVDWWDSTDSQFTLFPLNYEDQVTRMWEHCGSMLGSGGACHCKPGGVHLGPRLIPFCCGILSYFAPWILD